MSTTASKSDDNVVIEDATTLRASFEKLRSLDVKQYLRSEHDEASLRHLSSLLESVKKLGQVATVLFDKYTSVSAQVNELRDQNAQQAEEIATLSNEKAQLVAQVNALNASVKDGKHIASVQQHATELEQENERLKRDLKVARTQATAFVQTQQAHMEQLKAEHAYLAASVRARPRGKSMTMRRKELRDQEEMLVLGEAQQWLERVCGVKFANQIDFVTQLQTGITLCDALAKIDPQLDMGKVRRDAKPGSFFAHDNVHVFLRGCEALGLKSHQRFASSDLIGAVNVRNVGYCVLALARVAADYGIEPPELVKLEIDISNKVAASPPKRAKQHERQASKYTATAGDSIDERVAELCAVHQVATLPIRLREGEYQFGKHLVVHVREYKGALLVRANDRWQDFAVYLQEYNAQHRMRTSQLTIEEVPAEKGTDNDDDEKLSNDVAAHKEFFYLTCLAVKLNHNLKDEDIGLIRNDKLYDKALKEGLAFHQFAGWIEREITKAYLEDIVLNAQERHHAQSVSGLRAARRMTVDVINKRRNERRFHASTAEPEEDSWWWWPSWPSWGSEE